MHVLTRCCSPSITDLLSELPNESAVLSVMHVQVNLVINAVVNHFSVVCKMGKSRFIKHLL